MKEKFYILLRGDWAKIVKNAGWLYFDQIIRAVVSLVVFSLVVRSLGAEQFGFLSYAVAFPGILVPLAVLGLDYVVVRDFVRHPQDHDGIFGTALTLRFLAATTAFLIAIVIAWYAPIDSSKRSLLLVSSLTLLFQPFLTIDYYFQSQTAAKFTSISRITTSLLASFLRIILAVEGASVKWFVWVLVAETVIYSVGLMMACRVAKVAWFNPLRNFSSRIMTRLLCNAWPLFLADIAMTGYLKFDQLLLNHFSGPVELGKYAAAFRITEAAQFFAIAVINSYFPRIIQLHQNQPADFWSDIARFYQRMTWFITAIALVITVGAPLIANLIFGQKFGVIWPVIATLAWANIFVTQIAVRGKWFLAENLQKYSLLFFVIGAGMHLSLLPALAVRWGALGAALSFAASQLVMAVLAPVLFKQTRAASVFGVAELYSNEILTKCQKTFILESQLTEGALRLTTTKTGW